MDRNLSQRWAGVANLPSNHLKVMAILLRPSMLRLLFLLGWSINRLQICISMELKMALVVARLLADKRRSMWLTRMRRSRFTNPGWVVERMGICLCCKKERGGLIIGILGIWVA